MSKPLPQWFVDEVQDHLRKGHSCVTIRLAMTKRYAVVIYSHDIEQAIEQWRTR